MKKQVNLLLVALVMFTTTQLYAQIGTLTGKGMAICNDYSFTICPGEIITPLNYGSQNYNCTGTTHEDVSFVNQGTYWRVEIASWSFIANGCGAKVSGIDQYNNPLIYYFGALDVLKPNSYTTISGVDYVSFEVNGTLIPGFTVRRADFQIELNAASFSLTTTNGGVQGSSVVSGSHVWKVYTTPNGNTGPYTLVGTFTSANFSLNVSSPCYFVTHTLTTECGSSCAAQSICNASCPKKEKSLNSEVLEAPIENILVSVFPNPASSIVSFDIRTKDDMDVQISITDLNGKIIETIENTKTIDGKLTITWNTDSLSKGTYLVNVISTDQPVVTKKLIVE